MHLLAFSGSPTPGSAIGLLVHCRNGAGAWGTTVSFYEDNLVLPLFNPPLIAPSLLPPPAVAAIHQHLAAGAVLFATPEYAFGVPDSFKNTFDWLVAAGSLYGKTTGALSASPSASRGEHALANLLLTMPAAILSVLAARTRLGARTGRRTRN